MWGRGSGLGRGGNVAEKDGNVGNAGLLEKVGDAEDGDLKAAGNDEESFKAGGGFVRVDLNKADEGVDTGKKTTVPHENFGWRLHDSCKENKVDLFSEGCSLEVSESCSSKHTLWEAVLKKIVLK